MAYLNPKCAKCMTLNGSMWKNYCRARLAVNLCPNGYHSRHERSLVIIQDTQKMPRDNRGEIKGHIAYQKTWYV